MLTSSRTDSLTCLRFSQHQFLPIYFFNTGQLSPTALFLVLGHAQLLLLSVCCLVKQTVYDILHIVLFPLLFFINSPGPTQSYVYFLFATRSITQTMFPMQMLLDRRVQLYIPDICHQLGSLLINSPSSLYKQYDIKFVHL